MRAETVHVGCRAWALATILICGLGFPPSLAQDLFLPMSEWGRLDVRTRENSDQAKLVEVIVSSNNFESAASFGQDSKYRLAGRPVGRLDVAVQRPDGETGFGFCTGWLISSELVMTNYHCIPGDQGVVTKVNLWLGYLQTGSEDSVREIAVEPTPVESNRDLDYSIVRLSEPVQDFGFVDLNVAEVDDRQDLFVIQHPAGMPQQIVRRECRTVRVESGEGELVHTCDTLGGSSGSPVFSDDGEIVGLHFAGSVGRQENYAKIFARIRDDSSVLSRCCSSEEELPDTARSNGWVYYGQLRDGVWVTKNFENLTSDDDPRAGDRIRAIPDVNIREREMYYDGSDWVTPAQVGVLQSGQVVLVQETEFVGGCCMWAKIGQAE